MTEKLVYQAISAVAKEMAATGISKDRTNTQQNFKFRGIDQVYNALAPALVNHGLLILPRITERTVTERTTPKGTVLFYVVVKAEFDFVSTKDGSVHTVVTYGEAMDSGDKATNKAMSIAYKYAAFQAFCIPTEETAIDADAEVHHIQPADADTILAEFTQYAGAENDAKKLQEQYASTWTRLNGFPEHQAKCKDVTGIRIKELKQAA
ncbi:single-stranded DNA-binding protein [Cronobacter sakazakii]|uniref:ERF family protein n=1 Tax=Cronobacter TaxID=413496 RepID=UPI00094917FC|nr:MULTISPECIES: ERF family protein [Cronobacter]EGT4508907.1 single-stranded DNA-binding protein [Cronobacter sakazakii]MCI0279244.1 single-stranded DNA-binding protein [Cronobacter sakazakii]MDK1098212.1 ERF family protein [Cronobacter sakazakii]PUV97508.1 single-stranded DNA-binding protein [Cronobacter sakazakii]PUX35997.1 single-stranded DNA-binding protein [Cronobacter sakazakii]